MPARRHGMSGTPIYNIWQLMHKRCNDPKCRAYHNYGGRGITVCKRWGLFENFFADMGHRPEGRTLDRRNNNRGYSKSNCRWATAMEQSENSRQRRIVIYKGERYHITGFCKAHGISYNTIRARIQRGWEIHKAINQPIGKYDHHISP